MDCQQQHSQSIASINHMVVHVNGGGVYPASPAPCLCCIAPFVAANMIAYVSSPFPRPDPVPMHLQVRTWPEISFLPSLGKATLPCAVLAPMAQSLAPCFACFCRTLTLPSTSTGRNVYHCTVAFSGQERLCYHAMVLVGGGLHMHVEVLVLKHSSSTLCMCGMLGLGGGAGCGDVQESCAAALPTQSSMHVVYHCMHHQGFGLRLDVELGLLFGSVTNAPSQLRCSECDQAHVSNSKEAHFLCERGILVCNHPLPCLKTLVNSVTSCGS